MELILNELYYAVAFIPNLLPIKLKTPTANTGLLIKKYEALAMARPSAILDVVGDKWDVIFSTLPFTEEIIIGIMIWLFHDCKHLLR